MPRSETCRVEVALAGSGGTYESA